MTSVLGALQAEHGYLRARPGFVRSVGQTQDLIRVRDLPRRDWLDQAWVPELQDLMTRWLRDRPEPTRDCGPACVGCQARTLKPAQAVALQELADGHGAFLPLRPGAGKTLVASLAASVVQAQVPLLTVPAASQAQVLSMRVQYGRHWRLQDMTMVSYETLSAPRQVQFLNTLKPDLIVADEAHKLKNPSSKACKRIAAYLKANPGCRFVALSGSVMGRSIKEYWHYLRWAMRSMAPVPRDPLEMQAWAYALDEKVPPEARFEPGALLELAPAEGPDPITRARRAYRSRLLSTPGVVSTYENVPACGLSLTVRDLVLPPALAGLVARMRDTWQTPAGEDFSLAVDLWRHARDLGCGLFHRWDPPAPADWMQARRAWHAFVRDRLRTSRTFDSVVHLVDRIERGEEQDQGVYAAWRALRDTFKPNPVAVWCDTTVLGMAADWARARPMPLVWVQQHEFGARLSAETGIPFFSDQARDPAGRALGTEYTGPAIASMSSCYHSLNLQAWHENLITCPSSRGDRWDQLLARTQRDGQNEDVTAEVWIATPEARACFEQACRDAQATQDLKGQPHRLIYAEKRA